MKKYLKVTFAQTIRVVVSTPDLSLKLHLSLYQVIFRPVHSSTKYNSPGMMLLLYIPPLFLPVSVSHERPTNYPKHNIRM